MIVSQRGSRLLMVRQVDHQEQCALMADAWGNEDFARPEPFAALRLATARHDEGWRRWEDRPAVGADASPVDFPELDRRTHVRLYSEGIERVVAEDERAGLVASLHGLGLYEKRLGLDGEAPPLESRAPHERRFIEQERRRQERLATRLRMPDRLAPWAWSSFRLLQAWDALSLFLLWGGLPQRFQTVLPRVPRHMDDDAGVPIRVEPGRAGRAILDPYPFSRPEVAFPVAARWIPDRRYRDDSDLGEALDAAEWITIRSIVSR